MVYPAANFTFSRYLPLFDPDEFSDVSFYQQLEEIGYRQVLLGGTGSSNLGSVCRQIRRHTKLTVILYPAGPASVTDADLVLMPDVMNTNSHFARPFGTGAIATARNIVARRLPYLPVAYFILGDSTARWYYDAFSLQSTKLLIKYASYAEMVGYRYLALDCEGGSDIRIRQLIVELKNSTNLYLVVSSALSPSLAQEVAQMGVDTIVTPSNVYQDAEAPLELAAQYHHKLL